MQMDMKALNQIGQVADYNDRLFSAAIYYAKCGIPIVPIRKNGKALPPTSRGITYANATTDIEVVKSWWGTNGKFRGYNIGIACGGKDGVFALDIDTKDDGIENFRQLVDQFGELVAPIQKTPSGGMHFLFRWVEEAVSSTSKIAAGIDTRGSREPRPSSHIVAFPSQVEGGSYVWVGAGEIDEPPDWILKPIKPWNRGSENVGDEDVENQYTLEQLDEVIAHIPPDKLDYTQWLHIGMAIKTQHPAADGLALWDKWSKDGKRYVEGECNERWKGFDPMGTIRMGTLFHYAKDFGYNPSEHADLGEFADVIKKYNGMCAMTVVGNKPRVAMRDLSTKGINLFSKEDFFTWMGNDVVFVADAKGDAKPCLAAKVWMGSEHRNVARRGIGFFPDRPFIYKDYVNLWRGWEIEEEQGDWSLYDAHVKDIICDGDEELYTFVLDWLAHMVQKPEELPGSCIVMSGIEGCGKGTFVDFMGRALGQHYSHIVNSSHLLSNFNSHLMDKMFIFADEVTYGGDRKVAGLLKGIVTEKELTCEKKGYEAFSYENRARLVVASNEDWFIPAGAESRRWLVLRVSGKRANDREYFNRLYHQMEEGGIAAMLYDLRRRTITSNLRLAPETEALMIQRELYIGAGDIITQWWAQTIDKGRVECAYSGEPVTEEIAQQTDTWYTICDRPALYEEFTQWALGRGYKGGQIKSAAFFYRKMRNFGLKDKRTSIGSKRGYVFHIPEYEDALRILKSITGENIE